LIGPTFEALHCRGKNTHHNPPLLLLLLLLLLPQPLLL